VFFRLQARAFDVATAGAQPRPLGTIGSKLVLNCHPRAGTATLPSSVCYENETSLSNAPRGKRVVSVAGAPAKAVARSSTRATLQTTPAAPCFGYRRCATSAVGNNREQTCAELSSTRRNSRGKRVVSVAGAPAKAVARSSTRATLQTTPGTMLIAYLVSLRQYVFLLLHTERDNFELNSRFPFAACPSKFATVLA
jgi:hypothetical protein